MNALLSRPELITAFVTFNKTHGFNTDAELVESFLTSVNTKARHEFRIFDFAFEVVTVRDLYRITISQISSTTGHSLDL